MLRWIKAFLGLKKFSVGRWNSFMNMSFGGLCREAVGYDTHGSFVVVALDISYLTLT